MKKIYFVTSSIEKYEETKKFFDYPERELELYEETIDELQTENVEVLIKKKAFEAYQKIRRPLIVEHTALYIDAFENLPGLQTSHFYSCLGCEGIVDFCKYKSNFQACVESIFCFCDGKRYILGKGREEGRISADVDYSIKEAFAWDRIFVPIKDNPKKYTYNLLKSENPLRSMRGKAWEELKQGMQDILEEDIDINIDKDLSELVDLIKKRKVMLFVGAGISASVGLPNWDKLISHLGDEEGFESDLFKSHGNNMLLAEYIENNEKDKVYDLLKNMMDIEGNPSLRNKLEDSEIYQIITELNFPVIYTTNFDHLIEEYFKIKGHKINKVVDINDMINLDSDEECTRIMKFHGDIDNRKSIVLTESQYFKRMDFKSFMDIQLQADMLRYNILFLGYSLSDINVKFLLYSVQKQWKKEQKAFIYTATPNQIQKEVYAKKKIIAFSDGSADKQKGTLDFLKKLYRSVKEKEDDTNLDIL